MCRTKLVPLAILEPLVEEDNHLSSSNNSDHDSASPCPQQQQHLQPSSAAVAPQTAAVMAAAGPACKPQQHLPAPSRKNLSNRFRQIKPWPVIELPEDVASHPALPPGFKVEVYDGHLTQHFEVDSGEVVPTVGALSYVQHFNETGPYGRFRFQLCHNYACGRCAKGFGCTYLHINKLPAPTVVHVQGGTYEMMPAGVNLFVHTPHSQAPPQVVPSEYLIQTQGALTMMQTILEGKPANVQRPQHCAHFQYKRMCNRGYECGFLHSTIPAPR